VPTSSTPQGPTCASARVGLVVSRAVGPAVVRNRVKRRLRALATARLGQLPAGALLVVRANPAAAAASSELLGSELDRALSRVLRREVSAVGARRPAEARA
jgi:ribonuclease P protein component